MTRSTRKSYLKWAILISLLLNHALVLPGLFTLIAQKWAAPEKPEELPLEVELVDEPMPQVEPPTIEPPRSLKKKRLKKPKQRLALTPPRPTPPKPKLLKPPPPVPVPEEQRPPPPQPELERLKMVEVQNPETDTAPPDARFLSDKNRRVLKETRARHTNLIKDSARPRPQSKPSPLKTPKRGAEKKKIAETEEQKARVAKARPQPRRSPLMTMRSLTPARPREEPREMLAKPAPDGTLAPMQKQRPARRATLYRPQLDLDHRSLDRIDGKAAARAREIARLSPSTPRGSHDQKWQQIQSALENFIPEVQPGNQTALGTRANPFALYIAHMHRGIHKLWGFGFLVDLDRKPDRNPMNNMDLWTMVEIVVNPDGSVDKATIVHHSGLLTFDVAALDTVYTAGPYPATPRAIRSANGKVYMHWRFHRNQRQCGTFGVDPYLLTTPPTGPIDGNMGEVGRAPRRLRSLNRQRSAPQAHGGHGQAGGSHHNHSHTQPRQRNTRSSKKGTPAPGAAAGKHVSPKDPGALAAARAFLKGFRSSDPRRMSQISGLPFHAQGSPVAKSSSELTRMFADLIREASSSRTAPPRMMSLLEARSALSGLPPGAEYGKEMLVCLTRLGETPVTLILQREGAAWKVIGLNR